MNLEEILLYRVRDISLRISLGQRIFGVGTILLQSSDKSMPCLLYPSTYPVMGEHPVGTGQQYVDGAFGQKGGNPFDVM